MEQVVGRGTAAELTTAVIEDRIAADTTVGRVVAVANLHAIRVELVRLDDRSSAARCDLECYPKSSGHRDPHTSVLHTMPTSMP